MRALTILLIAFLLYSCISKKEKQIQLKYHRFEQALSLVNNENMYLNIKNLDQDFGSFNKIFESEIIGRRAIKDTAYANELLTFINHPDMREAYDSVLLVFSDLTELQHELNSGFTRFHNKFPSYPIPDITTFFGGFNYGVITYDNNIAIGLENFLGSGSKYYKFLGDPLYLRFQKQKKYITPNVMEAWFNEHFKQYLTEQDFLSELIYKGKVMFFIDRMLPELLLEDKFRFSESQMAWVIRNEDNIWSYFINNDLLYSSHRQEYRTFLDYGPFAKGMPKEAPARVAYFIGYNIINEYMNRNSITMYELITMVDSKKLLRDSKYKPKK